MARGGGGGRRGGSGGGGRRHQAAAKAAASGDEAAIEEGNGNQRIWRGYWHHSWRNHLRPANENIIAGEISANALKMAKASCKRIRRLVSICEISKSESKPA